ncbi:GNAT family N-acetyltransferase [Floricoccus penangensis]|uniref:GNAT family N-acetyltransferase n=1 Tax=Floricoccus penangensis TaxID=1859475 RepID=UPI00203F1483|nr:GNAT family protein [Floricoccus penangensis]URZ88301.1 GNAT family N-acetyltransferase [Floricoccus penangensis]
MDTKNYLVGETIYLDRVKEEDIDELLSIENSYATKFLADDELPYPQTREELENTLAVESPNQFLGIYNSERREIIGSVAVFNVNLVHSNCEIGLSISEYWQGEGVGTETFELILGHIFNNLPVNKIKVEVFDFNEPAIKLYEKFNFHLDGRLRQEIFRFGEYHDLLEYSLLREEYEANLVSTDDDLN